MVRMTYKLHQQQQQQKTKTAPDKSYQYMQPFSVYLLGYDREALLILPKPRG